ncbi:hypothetical protein H4S06_002984 [Coemansia sp. BCRC 34490]|nr:hypothetical protein H4S06_002984 [Coemansia sp. BCRC 34490]
MANPDTTATTTAPAPTAPAPGPTHYTCVNSGACEPCADAEKAQPYCQDGPPSNGDRWLLAAAYKQPVACAWDAGVAQSYRDSHALPTYVACDLADLGRRAFFRNQLVFVFLGLAAFVLYLWRRRRLAAAANYSVVQ